MLIRPKLILVFLLLLVPGLVYCQPTAGVSFSPDGELLLTRRFNMVRVWKTGSGELIATLNIEKMGFTNVDFAAFSIEGTYLLIHDGGALIRWNIAERTIVSIRASATPRYYMPMAVSPTQGILARAEVSRNGKPEYVELFDPESFATIKKINIPSIEAECIAFYPSNELLFIAGRTKSITISTKTDKIVRSFAKTPMAGACSVSPNETSLLLNGGSHGMFKGTPWIANLRKTRTRYFAPRLVKSKTKYLPGAAGYSPTDPNIAFIVYNTLDYPVQGTQSVLVVWNISSGKILLQIPSDESLLEAAISPDGKRISTLSNQYKANLFNLSDGALVRQYSFETKAPQPKDSVSGNTLKPIAATR